MLFSEAATERYSGNLLFLEFLNITSQLKTSNFFLKNTCGGVNLLVNLQAHCFAEGIVFTI